MKDFFKTKRFKGLLMAFFLLIGMTIGAARFGLLGDFTNSIAGAVLSPFENASSYIVRKATGFFERFVEAGVYYEENLELKQEVVDLGNKLIEFEKYKMENEQLREVLKLNEKYPEQIHQPAMVVARNPEDQFYSFTINKGKSDGIKVGDPVITPEGLIGRIEEVRELESRVVTLFNPNVEVSAYSVNSLDYGIVQGDLALAENDQSYMNSVSNESEMEKEDKIITAGSGVFPADIYIGKVISVEQASHGRSRTAVIELAVDIKRVKEVVVITSFKGQASVDEFGENLEKKEKEKEEEILQEEDEKEEEVSKAPESSTPPVKPAEPESSEEEESTPESDDEGTHFPVYD